jgi:VWFA-related protein
MRARLAVVLTASACGWWATHNGMAATTGSTGQGTPDLQRRSDSVPTIRTDARIVNLDVTVIDEKGHTVKGLTKEDFQLLEDGARQTISGFEEHTRPAQAETSQKLPPNTFSDTGAREESSPIVLMLDVLDTPTVRDQMYLRNQLISYIKTAPEGTRMAIVELDRELHLIQGFTSDRDELMEAVMKRDKPRFSPLMDPCAETPRPADIGVRPIGTDQPYQIPPINFTVGVPNPCLTQDSRISPYERQNDELKSGVLKQAVSQLGSYLSGYPGHKSMVWFYSDSAPGQALALEVQSMFADQTNFAGAPGRTSRVTTLNQLALTMVNTTMDWYPAPKPDEDSLVQLIANTNGLKEVVQHVEEKAWNYYTLSYSPKNSHFDGAFRKLNLSLERRGLHLQYRPGYYAINDDAKRANSVADAISAPGGDAAMQAAMQMGTQTPRDVRFTAHVDAPTQVVRADKTHPQKSAYLATSYRTASTRQYQIRYTVDAKTLDLKPDKAGIYRGHLDLVCVVYDDKGGEINSILSRASVHADSRSYAALLSDGVEVEQTVEIPATGNFFLRLGVHDITSGKVGVLEAPVGEIKVGLAENGIVAKP